MGKGMQFPAMQRRKQGAKPTEYRDGGRHEDAAADKKMINASLKEAFKSRGLKTGGRAGKRGC